MASSSSHKLDLYIQAHNQADQDLRNATTNIATMGLAAKGAGASLAGLEVGIMAVGGALAVVGGMLTGFTTQTIGAATGFEQAMANVKAIAGDSEEAFQKLTDRATELGMQTKFTASQAAEGMRFLAMTGYDANQVLAAIGPALDLAAASGMELAQTADILSNILTGFGLGAESAKSAANALAVVASKSNTNIQQMGEAMKYAANAAASAGLSINQAAAAVGVLGDSGIQASMAGTNLRGMLITLASPSNKAKEAFERLGVEIVKGKDGSVDLIATLERLRNANWKLADAADIFNRRVAAGAIALTKNVEKMRMLEWQTKVSTTSLEQMRDVMLATYSGAKVKLQSALNALSTTIGTHFLGALRLVTAALTKIVGWLKILADTFPTLTKVTVYAVTILGVLTAAIGSLMLVMGGMSLLLGAIIGKEKMLAAVEAVRAQGIRGLIASYVAKIQAIAAETMTQRANTAELQANTAALIKNGIAREGSGLALLSQSVAQAKAAETAKTAANKYGLLGAALVGIKDLALKAGVWIKSLAVAAWAAAAGSGGLSGALSALMAPLTAVFGALAGAVAIGAALGAAAWVAAREISGAGGVIREVNGQIEEFKGKVGVATAKMKELEKGYKAADGTLKQVNFYPRSLEQLQRMDPSAIQHYSKMVQVEQEKLTALFNQLATERQKVFDPSKGADEQSAEYVALTAQMKQVKGALLEVDTARRKVEGLSGEDLGDPSEIGGVAEAIEDLGGKSENLAQTLGTSSDEAKAKLQELQDAATKSAQKIKEEFGSIERDMERFRDDTARALGKVAESWREVSGDTDRTLEEGKSGFAEYFGALDSQMKQTGELFNKKSKEMGEALREGMQEGASSQELTALQDNMGQVSEAGIKAFERLRDEAASSLKDLEGQYERTIKALKSLTEEYERDRYQLTSQAEEARRQIQRRALSDEEKYYETREHLQNRLKRAKELEAKGDEESLKRAQAIRKDVMREAQQLQEVKDGKKTVIDQDQARADAMELVNQAEKEYMATSKATEEAKRKEMETQKKQLDEQIQKLEKLKETADQAAEALRSKMRVQIDDSDAKIKLAKLQEERRVKYVVDLEVNEKALKDWEQKTKAQVQPQGMATGGQVPGSGTGDTVPAMLTPGEFVMKAQAVKKYGAGLMAALNNMTFELPKFATGGLVEAPVIRRGQGNAGGVSNETERILNNFARMLSGIGDKFQKGHQINIKVNSDGSATLTGGGNVDLLG